MVGAMPVACKPELGVAVVGDKRRRTVSRCLAIGLHVHAETRLMRRYAGNEYSCARASPVCASTIEYQSSLPEVNANQATTPAPARREPAEVNLTRTDRTGHEAVAGGQLNAIIHRGAGQRSRHRECSCQDWRTGAMPPPVRSVCQLGQRRRDGASLRHDQANIFAGGGHHDPP